MVLKKHDDMVLNGFMCLKMAAVNAVKYRCREMWEISRLAGRLLDSQGLFSLDLVTFFVVPLT